MPSAVVDVIDVMVGRVASITISEASSKLPPSGIAGEAPNSLPAASEIVPPVTATAETSRSELASSSWTV